MLRLILITVLFLIICACAPVRRFVFSSTTPLNPPKNILWEESSAAYWEEERKKVKDWPEKFLALPQTQKPVRPLLDAWIYKHDRVESDQFGSRTYHWIIEKVSSSSSSWNSIHDRSGKLVGSYEVSPAPVRELLCEIHITANADGLITSTSYTGHLCPFLFRLP